MADVGDCGREIARRDAYFKKVELRLARVNSDRLYERQDAGTWSYAENAKKKRQCYCISERYSGE